MMITNEQKKQLQTEYKKYRAGKKLLHLLQSQNTGCKILIFPHRSLGDIYILGLFLQSKVKVFDGNFILVVVGGACKNVALEYGFKNVMSINEEEMAGLIKYIMTIDEVDEKYKILHFLYYHTSCFYNLINEQHLKFIECYEKFVFNEKLSPISHVTYKPISEKLIGNLDIDKGKTIVLAPYAKSIVNFPFEFWIYLTMVLKNHGYKNIYTNCSKNEFPIPNTKKLDVSLDEICGVLDYAGVFIGLRSGLCDIISRCKCKKIFFYSKDFLIKHTLEYLSFEGLPFVNNYREYEIEDFCVPYDDIFTFIDS